MTDLIALLEEARRIMRRMAARLRVVMDVHEDMIDDEDRLICIEIESFFDSLDAAIAELREQKPVAWMTEADAKAFRESGYTESARVLSVGADGYDVPLYFANAPVEPEPDPLDRNHPVWAMENAIDAYLDDYVTEFDEGTETPTDRERFIIKDAIMGLLVDEAFERELVASIRQQAITKGPFSVGFVVKHYHGEERPTIKGNGFDGLEVGTDRQEAEEFVSWINARLTNPVSDDARDAARYRWLRDNHSWVRAGIAKDTKINEWGPKLDAAIDAAMRGKGEGE